MRCERTPPLNIYTCFLGEPGKDAGQGTDGMDLRRFVYLPTTMPCTSSSCEEFPLGQFGVGDAGTARGVPRFREGPRTTVESISFEGNTAVSLPELARATKLAPGDPLAFERVEETRSAIQRGYLSRGYLYARVEAREDVDPERHVAAVRFVVSEGPRVKIGRIVVTGNRRTRGAVVRNALAVKEGATYDPDAFAASQASLLRLGVFRSVSLRVQDPEVPQETKDVAVDVSERPRATLTQGFGFSIANGPRAFLEWAQPNLLGRALEFTALAKVNYPLVVFRPDLEGRTPAERIDNRDGPSLSPECAQVPAAIDQARAAARALHGVHRAIRCETLGDSAKVDAPLTF
jgi:hypothetical protein